MHGPSYLRSPLRVDDDREESSHPGCPSVICYTLLGWVWTLAPVGTGNVPNVPTTYVSGFLTFERSAS